LTHSYHIAQNNHATSPANQHYLRLDPSALGKLEISRFANARSIADGIAAGLCATEEARDTRTDPGPADGVSSVYWE
jgi:hypothetical protein